MSGLRDVAKVDRAQLDYITGLRAASFALTPLLLGFLANQVGAGVIASLGVLNEDVVSTLGALNLSFAESSISLVKRVGVLALGSLVNAVAFGLGTLVGLEGLLAVPLVALGVAVGLLVRVRKDMFQLGFFAATVFVVGVGLPGGSEAAAYSRFWLLLAGGLWALSGAVLQWLAQRHGRERPPPPAQPASTSREIVKHSVVVAVTAAAGLAIAYFAGLQRDYWIMLTVIVCVRLRPSLTLSFTVMRVVGTVAGALLALGITVSMGSSAWDAVPLFVLAMAMFSTRNASFMVFSLFLTAFIIVLLNLAYPGDQGLALLRVLDTCIGGALSLVASVALWSRPKR